MIKESYHLDGRLLPPVAALCLLFSPFVLLISWQHVLFPLARPTHELDNEFGSEFVRALICRCDEQ